MRRNSMIHVNFFFTLGSPYAKHITYVRKMFKNVPKKKKKTTKTIAEQGNEPTIVTSTQYHYAKAPKGQQAGSYPWFSHTNTYVHAVFVHAQ